MKKILLILILAVISVTAFSQYQNLGSTYGNNMQALNALKAFQLPRGTDTTLNGRADTSGMLFYKTADKSLWLRVPNPNSTINKWVKIADSSGSSGGGGGSQSWDEVMTVGADLNSSYNSNFHNNNWVWDSVGTFTANINLGYNILDGDGTFTGTTTQIASGSGQLELYAQDNASNYSLISMTSGYINLVSTSGTTINNAYTLPQIDGISGYSLFTDGAGQLYWGAGQSPISSGDNTYQFQDSTNTPPVSFPSGFDTTYWMVGGAGTGIFSGHNYEIALYVNGVFDSFIVPTLNDWGQTLDDNIWHQYDGATWPRRNSPPWNTNGNTGGGVMGSLNNSNVFFRRNNTNFIIFQNNGLRFPQLTGAITGLMGLSTTGIASNVQVVPIANGGTNNGSLSVTAGTIYYGDGTKLVGLAPGTAGQHLVGGTTPAWKDTAVVGGAQGLQSVINVSNVLNQNNTISHTGFQLTFDGLDQIFDADNVIRGAAVDSVYFTSVGIAGYQAGTALELLGATGLLKGSTSTSVGFGSGSTVTNGWNSSTSGTALVGGANQSLNTAIKQAVIDTTTGIIGWQNTSSGTALTATYVGYGDGSNLLTGSANMTYASSVLNVFRNGIASTQTDAITLQNSTAATAGVPQYSPRLVLQGFNWNTGTAASVDNRFGISVVTQSAASPIAGLVVNTSVAGAAYSTTPTLIIQTNNKIGINTSSVTANTALDITEPAGGGVLVFRDEAGAGTQSWGINSTGNITITSSGGGQVITPGQWVGGFSSGTAGVGAVNFFTNINSNTGNNGAAYAGSANVSSVRVISNPTTTVTPTAGNNYTTFQIGAGAVTKAGSGTHDIFSNMSILGLNINSGAGTLTKTSTFVVNGISTGTGAPAGAFDNYSMWVYSGPSRFGGAMIYPFVAKTTTYTITNADNVVTGDATSAAFTITLPTAVGAQGVKYTIKKIDASGNAVNVGTTSSQTIDGAAAPYVLASQNKYVTVVSDNANWLVIGNN